MIISVMGPKGIRQYDLSRYPKTLLIFSAFLMPLVLLGIGYGAGWLLHPTSEVHIAGAAAPVQTSTPPSPNTEESSVRKSLAELQRRIRLLNRQLTESRQRSQASRAHVTALQSELQRTQDHLRSVVAAAASRSPAPSHTPATPTPPAKSSPPVHTDPYRLLARHPLAVDWLKLNHTLTATYPNPLPSEHSPSPLKVANRRQPHQRAATASTANTWGTTRIFRAKNKLLHRNKPFDRLYRRRAAISRIARKQLGKHYVWGAIGPKTFDCSGFTSYVYRKLGFNIPRTSRMQAKYGKRISRKNLRPGDLIFFDTSRNHRGYVNHVGIYIGNNRFIHASSARKRVIITSLNKAFYSRRFKWARRITN